MDKESVNKKYDWPGWRLQDNKLGAEFDLDARQRMVKGCRELLVFIKKYKKNLGKKVLEIGPFFDPLITSSEKKSVYYLENDKYALDWLRSNRQKVYNIDLNKKIKLPSSFFNSILVSQVFNYVDYQIVLKKINYSLTEGGLLFVNNVVDYGIKEFFSKNRPKNLEQTIKSIKSTGHDILVQKIIVFRVRNKKFKRLLIVAKKIDKSLSFSGKVIHGDHFGQKLGFPTANLDRRDYSRKGLNIKLGIYAGWAELPSGKKYRAAIVIGPIDKTGLPKLEAHLIGFKGNLYNKKIIINLGKYIRPFKKFLSVDLLKEQIRKDIQKSRELEN